MEMTKKIIEKYADVMIWGLKTANKNLKEYDTILIRFDLEGLDLAQEIYARLVSQRYNVVFRLMPTPYMEKSFYLYSDEKQRKFIAYGEKEFFENLNGNIYIHAPSSLTHLKDVDSTRQSEVAISRKFLRDIMNERESKGVFGWTLATFPTKELAKQARLSLSEYTSQIIKACFLNEKDPVKKWQEVFSNIQEIKKWLNSLKIKEIYLTSKNMDLTISIGERRRFLGGSGHNIPSFEIFTSPDCRYTKGVYFANLPTYRGGNYIENIELEFKDGVIIKAKAKKGEDYLLKTISTDDGSKRIGEFSLTDKRFSKIDKFMADILFDENYGGKYGNSHIAIGSSYLESYDGNPLELTKEEIKNLGFNDSAVHWDLINTEDKLVKARIDGGDIITLYENGMFKY